MREDLSGYVFARAGLVLTVLSLAGGMVFSGCPIPGPQGPQGPQGPPGPSGPPGETDRGGIAPGLNIVINSVTIPGDLRPVVNFTATDDLGVPLLKAEFTDARFILGFLMTPAGAEAQRYESYTTSGGGNANYDGARLNGVTEVADGTFDYKFGTPLPGGYDMTATHQIAGQFRRVFGATGETYRANVADSFRPDGLAISNTREWVTTESCNQCHTRISEHGNIRREMQLCIMCHNHQSIDADTGNSVDMAVLIHKIHMGEELPSVQDGEPYQIVGFGGTVHDYSTVVYPQDIRNCNTCHATTAKADFHLNNPSIEGCGACHDRTWFGEDDLTPAGFEDHFFVPVTNASCASCHKPGGIPDLEDTTDIALAHQTEEEKFGPGLSIAITNISVPQIGMTSDLNLVVEFMLTDGMGMPIDMLSGATMNILAATLAHPVPEYETNVRETLFSSFGGAAASLVNNGNGLYTYTFDETLPMGSPATYAVAFEGRRPFVDEDDPMMPTLQQGTSSNAQTLFTVDGSAPAMRREIVAEESCNVCHEETRAHGQLRTGMNFCLMCHHPNATDEAQRPGGELPPETINFKDLIHAIHMGEDLEEDFTVYGFGMNEHNFKEEIRFPGARQECAICHVDDTQELPIAGEALSTMIVQQSGGPILIEELQPTRAACNSCHNGPLSELHALLNTDLSTGQESCMVCHGPGQEFAVDVVHELSP